MPTSLATLHRDHLAAQLDHLHGMLNCADRGDAQDPCIAKPTDHFRVRSPAKTDRVNPVRIGQDNLNDLWRPGLERVEIHPESMGGQISQPSDGIGELGRIHHRPGQKAEGAGIAGCGNQLRGRNPPHRGLDHGNAAPKAPR